MIRKMLLTGKLTEIEFFNDFDNTEIVLTIRHELQEFNPCYSFDMIPNAKGELTLVFLYDHDDPALQEHDCTAQLTRLLTGEGINGCVLPYPIVDARVPQAFGKKTFEYMWRKNNQAFGGDDFRVLSIIATYTRLIAILKFDGFDDNGAAEFNKQNDEGYETRCYLRRKNV